MELDRIGEAVGVVSVVCGTAAFALALVDVIAFAASKGGGKGHPVRMIACLVSFLASAAAAAVKALLRR